MRIWHKDLISVLPEMQLKGQWRECCLIAKALLEGNLNHVLVNRVKDYPTEHFFQYCGMVFREMQKRGYKVDKNRLLQYAILYEVQAFENEPIIQNGIERTDIIELMYKIYKNHSLFFTLRFNNNY